MQSKASTARARAGDALTVQHCVQQCGGPRKEACLLAEALQAVDLSSAAVEGRLRVDVHHAPAAATAGSPRVGVSAGFGIMVGGPVRRGSQAEDIGDRVSFGCLSAQVRIGHLSEEGPVAQSMQLGHQCSSAIDETGKASSGAAQAVRIAAQLSLFAEDSAREQLTRTAPSRTAAPGSCSPAGRTLRTVSSTCSGIPRQRLRPGTSRGGRRDRRWGRFYCFDRGTAQARLTLRRHLPLHMITVCINTTAPRRCVTRCRSHRVMPELGPDKYRGRPMGGRCC